MNFIKKFSDSHNSSDLLKQAQGFLSENKEAETTTPAPPAAHTETAAHPPAAEKETAAHPPAAEKETAAHPPTAEKETPEDSLAPPAPSTGTESKGYADVYGSAQTLYEGIQGKLTGKTDVDDKKLAGAAENVLKAAESSGYLGKDNQYGDYFAKAETYLHNYGTGSAAKPPAEDAPSS